MNHYFNIATKQENGANTVQWLWNAIKDNSPSAWYNARCMVEGALDVDSVTSPDSSCQADVPHLLHFARDIPQSNQVTRLSNRDSETASGTFEMPCPKPHFLNTGPHRTMIWVSSYKGESYVIAVEEAKGIYNQNVFIGSFSQTWQEHLPNLPKEFIGEVVSAAVFALKGIKLNSLYHDFDITVVDPYELVRQGCQPSPKMQPW